MISIIKAFCNIFQQNCIDFRTFILKRKPHPVTTGVNVLQELVFAASCRCIYGNTLLGSDERMRSGAHQRWARALGEK